MAGSRRGQAPAQTHYLPGNKISWSPPVVAFLKTITETIPGSNPETLRLTGWLCRLVIRRGNRSGRPDRIVGSGQSAATLAEFLTERTRGHETVWLFTHNAALDLVTTRLPLVLNDAGWDVNDASLSGAAPWLRLAKGSRRLCVVDSFSWLPHTPADLAERLSVTPPRRAPTEMTPEWAKRSARHDLDVVSQAMLELLDWWDANELGKWSVSGPSTGWHAMRHIPTYAKCVIDPDPERIAADRKAIHGGRRGAWLVGSRSLGPFIELDFTNAYPSVAAHLPLPSRRGASFASMALDNWRLTSDRWGIIADVEILSDVPRWPVRISGSTFCPIGRFRATLAGPEIREALSLGCLVAVGPGITHQLGPFLAPWGEWIRATIHNQTGDTPTVARLAAKAWSRSTPGKFASRAYERVNLGLAEHPGWHYEEGWDRATGTRFGIINLAGQRWESVVNGDAEQAYPAIFAWLESETRVRLSRVIEAIGPGAIIQCDTDGLIVSERIMGTHGAGGSLVAPVGLHGAARTAWVLNQLDPLIAPLSIRIKAKHKTIRVLGPQHVDVPGNRKFAGLPKLATEGEPDVYSFKQWPGLSYQLGHGDARGYVRPETTVRVNGPYAPGWVLADGRVLPVECRIREDGNNQILGWGDTVMKPRGARLAESQHPVLAALW